jgi:hypothetical protein
VFPYYKLRYFFCSSIYAEAEAKAGNLAKLMLANTETNSAPSDVLLVEIYG